MYKKLKKWLEQLTCKHEWKEEIFHGIALKATCKKCGKTKLYLLYF